MGISNNSNHVIPSGARNLLLRERKKQIPRPQRPRNDNVLERL